MIINDVNTMLMMQTSDILYELPSTFTSNGSNYIDTGVLLSGKRSIVITFSVTNWANTDIRFVFGNIKDYSISGYQSLQTQYSGGRRLFGGGVSWTDGLNFANNNQIIKYAGSYDFTTSTRIAKAKNTTTSTTKSSTAYDLPSALPFNIFLGQQETGVYSGFTGVITDFKIYNRLLTSAEIDAYIA